MIMSQKYKQYPTEFKDKVDLSAVKNEQTISDLAALFEVHPTMNLSLEKASPERAAEIFDKGHKYLKHRSVQRMSYTVRSDD